MEIRECSEAAPARAGSLWRRMRAISSQLAANIDIDWRRAPLWAPVAFGAGVALFFAVPTEPRISDVGLCVFGAGALTFFARMTGPAAVLAAIALLLVALGTATGAVRARFVSAPVLAEAGEYLVTARYLSASRSGSGATRLLADQVEIDGLEAAPTLIRVTVPGMRADDLHPGERLSFDAYLAPPPRPSEPGGFDFRRRAWFQGLGAVGRIDGEATRLGLAQSTGYLDQVVMKIRQWRAEIAAALRARLPGAEGAFAAAILVGDRAAIPPRAVDDLRASNLAHLLAISGLHMALVTGFVFAAARGLTALAPPIVLRFSGKKIAALAAIVAGLAYLALSGASVATQRAFIMVAVALIAVLLDRPAVTLRALALAAMIVLAMRPESLVEPGFQMSFAATAALVAVYGESRDRWREVTRDRGLAGRIALYVSALALTSLVAGAATAPFAAHHFNRVSSYGLIANVAAAPVMGLWVMPSAMLSAALAPIGLDGWGSELMGQGVAAILAVARWVAELPDATRSVAKFPAIAFAALTLGGLMVCIGTGAGRAAGLAALAFAAAAWLTDDRPQLLIAEQGRLVGALGPEGRALSMAGGRSDFTASTWLRRDGDAARPKEAARRSGLSTGKGWLHAELAGGWRLEGEMSRASHTRLEALCRTKVVLLAPRNWRPPAGPCLYIGPEAVNSGPLAVEIADDQASLATVADRAGQRMWTGDFVVTSKR